MWYVYIVRCQDFSLYTGITNDIHRRIKAHNSKKGSKSVIAHGLPVKLIYMEEYRTKSEALKREIKIKKMTKIKKEKMIEKADNFNLNK